VIPGPSRGGAADGGKELLRLYRELPEEQQRTLLAFARFLVSRG
jgi:hypothetical protein